jgi:hypothetical protein
MYLAAKGISKLPTDNYLIFYTVNKSTTTVNIVRVLHGKRDGDVVNGSTNYQYPRTLDYLSNKGFAKRVQGIYDVFHRRCRRTVRL